MNNLEKYIPEFLNILYEFTGKLFTEDMFYLKKPELLHSIYKLKENPDFLFLFEDSNSFSRFSIGNIKISKDTFALASNSNLKVIFYKNKTIEITSSFYFNKDKKFDLIYIKKNKFLKLQEVYISDLSTFKRYSITIEKFHNYTRQKILKYNYDAEKIIPNYNLVSVFDFTDKALQDQLNLFNIIQYN